MDFEKEIPWGRSMGGREGVSRADRVLESGLDWILEAFAPLRFPLAQGLWLLSPWLGSEQVARWVADLEAPPGSTDEAGGSR